MSSRPSEATLKKFYANRTRFFKARKAFLDATQRFANNPTKGEPSNIARVQSELVSIHQEFLVSRRDVQATFVQRGVRGTVYFGYLDAHTEQGTEGEVIWSFVDDDPTISAARLQHFIEGGDWLRVYSRDRAQILFEGPVFDRSPQSTVRTHPSESLVFGSIPCDVWMTWFDGRLPAECASNESS